MGVPHAPAGKAGENGQRSASSGKGTWLRPSVATGAKALFSHAWPHVSAQEPASG